MEWTEDRARRALNTIFTAAVKAADPHQVLAAHLPEKPRGRCIVVGAGKSAAAMAAALENAWPDVDLSGVVVTRDGHTCPTQRIDVLEASHPVPDARSEAAARRILETVSGLTEDDMVIALISGGGSSLMVLPGEGLTIAHKQDINRALLRSGATISEMNAVRRQLSGIKGGRLAAAAAPARVITLGISDVPGDEPAVIASGPTVPDPTTAEDAKAILKRYRIEVPPEVSALLDRAAAAKPAQPKGDFRMIAAPLMALEAAAAAARAEGLTPLILGDSLEGESHVAGTLLAGIAQSVRQHGYPLKAPAVLLSGGETTVTIAKGQSAGRGGRNTEFLLSLALTLNGASNIYAVAGDTDGIDGTEDAAGAIVTPDTLARAQAKGLDPRAFLDGHDSYSLFDAVGDLIKTGATLTNVNDIRAIVIL
ncbi:Glycerate dehydrogenase [Granulibacter bethesdensis]|uniref:glycerate kinase type-2 family protein n=1 Tax=Granulibacter bethesdensis TaxID=364410 RepID=UPI00090C49A0|nr:glycerate kinase [Granulibacter bethesdensis]APH56161.1 Glycerate dehydrogenase [Granulibacter bethesdensis]